MKSFGRGVLSITALLAIATFAGGVAGEPEPKSSATAAAAASSAASAVAIANAPSIEADNIREAVKDLAKDAAGWGATAAAMVIEVPSGAVVASNAEHEPMNPASNAKLATAAGALRVFGPEKRFFTGLYGKVSGDKIGALVIRGAGDPTLTSADITELAKEVKTRGIKKVEAIYVDQSAFDNEFTPPAFAQQPNEWAPFRAPISAVSVDAGTLTVTVLPTENGKPATVRIEPAGIANVVGTVKTTKNNDPEKFGLSMSVVAGVVTAKVSGHVPEGGGPVRAYKRLEDPQLAAGFVLREALKAWGIETGDVRLGDSKEKNLLAAHRSEPLGHILAHLGKDSDNFVAEMVFKSLAIDKHQKPASFGDAAQIVMGELRAMNAFDAGSIISNGSGLFDANRTTTHSTVQLLRAMALDTRYAPEMFSHLAVGGVDGTLRSRFKPWSKTRAIRAKTGTLNAVFALSGYVLAPPGKPTVAFSLYINNAKGKAGQARAGIDRVVEAIAKSLWREP
ncbi:MAG: D-alanyl-D-alanine carboxypeptidase/D-alanyl-D-alanine-endopeptidase [Polyangiaceae bacterium]|nr:D-alanyl-D-alanine carboxypeptidase/D-alanyl-D-alanine-endopeptidase [Polyangiaceae bacterium]